MCGGILKLKIYIVWVEDLDSIKYGSIDDYRENTTFEYDIGEIITVNNTEVYKCIKKELLDGDLYHYFKKGEISYDFSF